MEKAKNQDYIRTLQNIVSSLPHNRVEQLLDFARFLEAQVMCDELVKDEDLSEIDKDNARWDALLESDKSQVMLGKLANEALKEYYTGKIK